jgi:hypothetical protein
MADTRLEPLVLTGDERRTLENWVKRRSTAQGLALRARIVLACAQGGSNVAVGRVSLVEDRSAVIVAHRSPAASCIILASTLR